MADADYKRLGCVSFECQGVHQAQGLCAKHYARMKRTGSTECPSISCVRCGKSFESKRKNSMYCSNACKVAAWNAKNGRIKCQYVKQVSAYWTGYCVDCGAAIGGLRKRNLCAVCQRNADRTYAKNWAFADAERLHKEVGLVVSCGDCKVLFCPMYGASHTKLCLCCRKDRDLMSMRTSRLARKMRERTQTVERVNLLKVLERDNWTCQICKRETPKSLRGTIDPMAPEVDHIIPISLGGEHSYINTQCACRACNATKSNHLAWDAPLEG